MKVTNFIKSFQKVKEKNELDISKDQDLSIGLMNLVSLEEHSFFSYAKTQDDKFLGVLDTVRELRKKLLAKIVKKSDGSETWCMSKHLLASSMRLYEVANRLFHEGNEKEAKEMYNDSAELYGLFWKLNSSDNLHSETSIKPSIFYSPTEKKGIFSSIKKLLECCKE